MAAGVATQTRPRGPRRTGGAPSLVEDSLIDLQAAASELANAQRELVDVVPALAGVRRREAEASAMGHVVLARRLLREILFRHRVVND